MSNNTGNFMPLDFETTGLDPHKCGLLEFAVVLANDGPGGDMQPVEVHAGVISAQAPAHGVIKVETSKGVWSEYEIDQYVVNMHTHNGLLDECYKSDVTVADVDDFLASLCEGAPARGVILLGNSVHFDLGFAKVHLPKFAAKLSHRVLDVSSFMVAEKCWRTTDYGNMLPKVHRAEADVLQSLDTMRDLRAKLWGGK